MPNTIKAIVPRRTIAKIIATGQKTQDHDCFFLMFCMALCNEKAVAMAPSGARRRQA
jgi:hypothetical protein